jgi:hypothetical protein
MKKREVLCIQMKKMNKSTDAAWLPVVYLGGSGLKNRPLYRQSRIKFYILFFSTLSEKCRGNIIVVKIYPEDGGIMFIRNVSIYVLDYIGVAWKVALRIFTSMDKPKCDRRKGKSNYRSISSFHIIPN